MSADRNNIQLFLKDVLHNDRKVGNCFFLNDGFDQDLEWYCMVFEQEHRPVKLIKREEVIPDEKIVVFLAESKKFLEKNYYTQVLDTFWNVSVYKLNGRKPAF